MKPFLKWAGGKKALAPLFPKSVESHFVELFAGSAAISLTHQYPHVILNDLNPDLIYAWQSVKTGMLPITLDTDATTYYQIRKEFNEKRPDKTLGLYFIYLNRVCFRGVCRYNKKGEFNTSYGHLKSPVLNFNWEKLKLITANWSIQNKSWEDINLNPKDFIYADPPYLNTWGNYTPGSVFSYKDHESLAQRLEAHPGPVAISNSIHALNLYTSLGFKILNIKTIQRISNNTTPEILAIKNWNPIF